MKSSTKLMPTAVMSGSQLRRPSQPAVGDELDGDVDARAEGHAADQRDQEDEPPEHGGARGRHPEDRADDEAREQRAQHEQVAVGEVDQFNDAVDQGVAEGDEREQRSVLQARHG
jgi:hypothetical protein